ncbi:MAG: ClbS/DfsB family four-helix bundle protein [Chloroflexi bacterium]|nr:ClbS/DfsB family four-helix bundle protein [Chloroflexota bacterium]
MQPELDKLRLLQLMRAEHAFLVRTLDMLTPEQMTTPFAGAWSAKDMLAHLTYWMELILKWLDQAGHGEKPDVPENGFDDAATDRLNNARAAADKDRPLAEIRADFDRTYQQMIEMVEALSEAALFAHDWDGMFSMPPGPLIAENTYEHFYEHIVPLRQWIAEQRRA